jgi:hypothetical protein
MFRSTDTTPWRTAEEDDDDDTPGPQLSPWHLTMHEATGKSIPRRLRDFGLRLRSALLLLLPSV